MNLIRQAIRLTMATVLPRRLLMTRGPASGSACRIALTFDDGPHPKHTPLLLDYLAASEIKATFFVIGDRANACPSIVRRISDEGHDIGNHTFTHGNPLHTSSEQFLEEVCRTRQLIQDLTGRDTVLTRPPKGKITMSKLRGLWRQNQTAVLWNVDPRDFQMRSNKQMEHWCSEYVPRNGDILLMHDNHPHASVAIRSISVSKAFENVAFVRVSDWLSLPNQSEKRLVLN